MQLRLLPFIFMALALSQCGPRDFVRGDYDKDVSQENLLTDKWSETDMQKAVKDLVSSAENHYAIRTAKVPPVVLVTRLQNKTSEHIDTQNITDMIRVELMRSGKMKFVDDAARDDSANEYEYQDSGMVSRATKKGPGGQVGADFILNGRLESIVQQAGKDKTVYYKITLNMTDLKSSLMVWSDYKEIRKRYEKQRVGM